MFCFICYKGEKLPVSFLSSHEEGPAAKKCKTEKEEGHISISSVAEGNVTKVNNFSSVSLFPNAASPRLGLGESADIPLSLVLSEYEPYRPTPCPSFFLEVINTNSEWHIELPICL